MLKITKGVPLPSRRAPGAGRPSKYNFERMEVGDVIFVPERPTMSLRPYVSRRGRELGRSFTVRLVWLENKSRKGWVVANKDTPGAVQGVGIWRTA